MCQTCNVPRPPPIPRKMMTKESASKQVTSLHSTIRVQVRWGLGWGQIFPDNAAAEIFYRNRTSGVVAVAVDEAITADKCSNFWPSQGCSVKICQNMLSEHSYRGLLLRSLSSRSDWTHGADRVTTYFCYRLQSMQKLQIIQNILTVMCTISDFIWLSIVRSSWGAWVGNWSHFLVYNEDNLLVQIFLLVGKCQNYFPMKSH